MSQLRRPLIINYNWISKPIRFRLISLINNSWQQQSPSNQFNLNKLIQQVLITRFFASSAGNHQRNPFNLQPSSSSSRFRTPTASQLLFNHPQNQILIYPYPPSSLQPLANPHRRPFSSSSSSALPVLKKLFEIMSKPDSKTLPLAPSATSLCDFLDRNQNFASTCDREVLAQTCKGQSPSVFWLGCSDSRVPEGVIIQAGLGEVFVHRNVANVFNPEDTSATAALAFAVNNLKVTHVVVVGHESCGGCAAALSAAANQKAGQNGTSTPQDLGEAALTKWIDPIKKLAFTELEKQADPNTSQPSSDSCGSQAHFDLPKLVQLNVESQVNNIVQHEIVQKAWARGQTLSVHGWVYHLSSGKVQDLGLTQSKP